MSLTATSRLQRVRQPGTSEWWLVYLLGPPLVLLVGIALFPRTVYDAFVWQYLWGPVVADAAGEPVTRNGITATEGYTAVNTLVYLGIVGYSLPGLRVLYERLAVELDARLAFALVPLMVAGGAMRALADAAALGGYEVLFITPTIYGLFAVAAIASIALGDALARRQEVSAPAVVAILGGVWATAAVGYALVLGVTTAETFRPAVPIATLGIAVLATAGFYLLGRSGVLAAFTSPIYLLVAFGQLWDGAQNLVGTTMLGYEPKMFLTHHVAGLTGFSGSTFFLKLGLVPVVVWVLADFEDESDGFWWWVFVVGIVAVGLPMGVRGSLRMARGV